MRSPYLAYEQFSVSTMKVAKSIIPDFLFIPYRKIRDFNKTRTTDIFIIGYPRSGNTWNRYMLGRYIQSFCGIDTLPLFNQYDFWGRCYRTCIKQTIIANHGQLNWESLREEEIQESRFVTPYKKKKIVLLTRYPLDSLVSNWVYYTHLSRKISMTLEAFLDHPLHSLTKWINYHNLWAHSRREFKSDLLLLRYEDLRRNTKVEFVKMLDFLQIETVEAVVDEAIQFASFDNMKKMQKMVQIPGISTPGERIIRVGDPADPESHHVRKGIVGGYRDYLSQSKAKFYERRIADELEDWFGYSIPPIKQE